MSLKQASALQPTNNDRGFRIASFVALLLGASRPSAVGGLVVAVIVDAIQRMIGGWTTTHVGQEGLVRCAPAFADDDTALCVQSVAGATFTGTAVNHRGPRLKFRRPLAAFRFAVRSQRRATFISLVAPTTASNAAIQPRTHQDLFPSALAATEPVNTGARPNGLTEYRPARESLTGMEFKRRSHHALFYQRSGHGA